MSIELVALRHDVISRCLRRDATIGLATMQTDATKWVKTSVSELTASEKDTLADWVGRFSMKYRIVGYLNDGAAPKSVATHGPGSD